MACVKRTPNTRHEARIAKIAPKGRNCPIRDSAARPDRRTGASFTETSPTTESISVGSYYAIGLRINKRGEKSTYYKGDIMIEEKEGA